MPLRSIKKWNGNYFIRIRIGKSGIFKLRNYFIYRRIYSVGAG